MIYNSMKYFFYILLAFSILSANDLDKKSSIKERLKNTSLELLGSSYTYEDGMVSGELNGIRYSIIGNYKENKQLYFSAGFNVLYRKNDDESWAWDNDHLSLLLGLFHRTNFASNLMFLDWGVFGEEMGSFGGNTSRFLIPEVAMGFKLPLSKKQTTKLVARLGMGYRLLDKTDWMEKDSESDKWNSIDYYPSQINLRVCLGIGF